MEKLKLWDLIKIGRPIHWVKNISLFAALIFTANLFNPFLFSKVLWAFIAFSLATSATYIFNDIFDVKSDRLHPIKKFRPIASGRLSVEIALVEVVVLAIFSILLARSLSFLFFVIIVGYLILQIAYSLVLKNIVIIDIIVIATGFILRIYAGAFVINAHLSVWFLLCVISVSLFLASGKRRAELNIVEKIEVSTRKSLAKYKRELLNSYVTMFGNAAWMSWALFTFFESPKAPLPIWLFLAEISKATTIDKLMMLTIPVVIFGIMRYQFIIYEGKSEAPEKILLTDIPLISSIALWLLLVFTIIYGGSKVLI